MKLTNLGMRRGSKRRRRSSKEEEEEEEEELIPAAPVNQVVFESDRDLGELGSEKKDDDE